MFDLDRSRSDLAALPMEALLARGRAARSREATRLIGTLARRLGQAAGSARRLSAPVSPRTGDTVCG